MGHVTGKEIRIGYNLDQMIANWESENRRCMDFVNSYSCEVEIDSLVHNVIKTDKIDPDERLYKKDLNKVDTTLTKNRPDSHTMSILPLGIFAWEKYSFFIVDPITTSEKYKISACSKNYIEERKRWRSRRNRWEQKDFEELICATVESKKKARQIACEKTISYLKSEVCSKVEGGGTGGCLKYKHNYDHFLEGKFERCPIGEMTYNIYILNESNEFVGEGQALFTPSSTKLNRFKSYNKKMRELRDYAIYYDVYVG